MTTVATPYIETPITLSVEHPFLLIIENPHEYLKTVTELQKAMNGEMSNFTFWEDTEEIIPAKKGEILLELFSFDFCDKKIINLLHKNLQNNYLNGAFLPAFQEISSTIEMFLQDMAQTIDFSIEYDTITIEALLKVCSVRPAKTYESILEKLICYVNIFLELKKIDFVVIVGLKQILTDDDLHTFFHHCLLKKVKLFLIEPFKSRPLLPEEKAIILTDDLCEIVENFSDE